MIRHLFPIGRLVGGSVCKPFKKTDRAGNPRTYARGARIGQPIEEYAVIVALQKDGRPWQETEWGRVMVAEAGKMFTSGQPRRPDFAWKIVDGDSTIPNKKGKIPYQREGYSGHWVIAFATSALAPVTVSRDGRVAIPADSIKCGDYVQVLADIEGNGLNSESPGLYLNPVAVALSETGPEIVQQEDFSAAGFGGALPAGATPVPRSAIPSAPAGTPTTGAAVAFANPGVQLSATAQAAGMTLDQVMGMGMSVEQLRAAGLVA